MILPIPTPVLCETFLRGTSDVLEGTIEYEPKAVLIDMPELLVDSFAGAVMNEVGVWYALPVAAAMLVESAETNFEISSSDQSSIVDNVVDQASTPVMEGVK